MPYILNSDKIIKIITKSNDVKLTHITIDDEYPYKINLMFDFETNILFENEIFKIKGYFGKFFNKYYQEEKDNFYITINNKHQLPEKLIDDISLMRF